MALAKLPKKIATIDLRRTSAALTPTRAARVVTGRARKDRRYRLWCVSPLCAKCGRLLEFLPTAFEVDHRVPLEQGGADTDANCQLLCVVWEAGRKLGCHMDKSNAERARGL